MADDWVERKRIIALEEFELAKAGIMERYEKDPSPVTADATLTMVAMIEHAIGLVEANNTGMPRWVQGVLFALVLFVGTKYRRAKKLAKMDTEDLFEDTEVEDFEDVDSYKPAEVVEYCEEEGALEVDGQVGDYTGGYSLRDDSERLT